MCSTWIRKWTRSLRWKLRKWSAVNRHLHQWTHRKSQTKKRRKSESRRFSFPFATQHSKTYAYFRIKSNVTVRLLQCCALNGGIFLLSILFFDYILMAYLKNVITFFMGQSTIWNYIQTTLSWIFSFIWIVPLFVLSKIINTFWFQDIADAAYEFRNGRPTLIPCFR